MIISDSSTALMYLQDARDFLSAAKVLEQRGESLPGEVDGFLADFNTAQRVYLTLLRREKERKIADLIRMRYEKR